MNRFKFFAGLLIALILGYMTVFLAMDGGPLVAGLLYIIYLVVIYLVIYLIHK